MTGKFTCAADLGHNFNDQETRGIMQRGVVQHRARVIARLHTAGDAHQGARPRATKHVLAALLEGRDAGANAAHQEGYDGVCGV